MTDNEDYDRGYEEGYEAALDREGLEPDAPFLRAVMHRFGLAGPFWEEQFRGAMMGDPACAAHVLAHCEFEYRDNEETI
jgi:hypothetical protein